MKNLVVTVDHVTKRCGAHLQPGDSFQVVGQGKIVMNNEKGTCMFALQSLIPFLISKQREDELTGDDWIKQTHHLCCPDPDGVVFRIETE